MFFAKLALFLFYYRVFGIDRGTRIAIYLGIIIIALFYFSSIVALSVLCIPKRSESWTSLTYGTRCKRAVAMGNGHGVFGLISDVYIFILPLPVLLGLQMSLKRKLGVAAIFCTGLLWGFTSFNPFSIIVQYELREITEPLSLARLGYTFALRIWIDSILLGINLQLPV